MVRATPRNTEEKPVITKHKKVPQNEAPVEVSVVKEKGKKRPVASTGESKPVKRVIRKVKKTVEPVTPVEDVQMELETPSEEIVTPGGTRTRREVTPDSVEAAFNELCVYIETEIARQRDLKEKNGGRPPQGGSIKFLRSALKRSKQLQGDVRRVARKKRATRLGNNNSGFMKETLITDKMADFLGVEHGTMMSRVECTKRLHAYIKAGNLQNPANRREIRPDQPLATLLNYNRKSVDAGGHGPLFYYVMQQLIQQHFIKA